MNTNTYYENEIIFQLENQYSKSNHFQLESRYLLRKVIVFNRKTDFYLCYLEKFLLKEC